MNAAIRGPAEMVLSYLALRKAIGVIGTALPFVLALGGLILGLGGIEPSISAYYYTGMRNVFVGSLCAIAVFMGSYHGYERADDLLGDVACLSALGVALCPMAPAAGAAPHQVVIGTLHYVFAAIFFLTLAAFCLWLFRKTDGARSPTPRKRTRNAVYLVCGVVILACVAAILLATWVLDDAALDRSGVVFWLEAIAVVAFGSSWLTKGELLLADREPTAP
jgi:hypothetical protein